MQVVVRLALLAALISPSARAVDGVLEINQACAIGPGCFAGDAPGFPVEIDSFGSYRLTGNLTAPNQNTTMIYVSSTNGVSLDLNGFAIRGANVSLGGDNCSAPGTGIGVHGFFDVAVSNGHIRGMGSDGLRIDGAYARIERVTAEQNCGNGIYVANNSLVRDAIARQNGGDGISGFRGIRVGDSIGDLNGSSGIDGDSDFLVVRSVANANSSTGIGVLLDSIVLDSTANNNSTDGIFAFDSSLILRNSVNGNGSRGVSATPESGIGFLTANGNGIAVFGGPIGLACSVAGGVLYLCP